MLWLRLAFASIVVGFAAMIEPSAASELRHESVMSAALGHPMPFVVYLPDDYDRKLERYPVLYLLHGAGGNENAWSERGHIQEKADQLIRSGAIPPMIIVMPGCPTCWWVDGTLEKAETAFWSDLVPAVALRYRTIEARGGRLIAGLSAGGYGAVRFALRYPDRIAAAAALSPACYSVTPPTASAARRQPPFLKANGEFDQTSWDAHNYPGMLDPYFAQRFRVPLYLVSGDHDRLGIAYETALLFQRVFEYQPERVALRVVNGDHSWQVWEGSIADALRYIGAFADKPQRVERTAKVFTAHVESLSH